MGNSITQAQNLRNSIECNLEESRLKTKDIKRDQRQFLVCIFSKLETIHKLGAHKMTIALVGAWFGILSSPFGEHDPLGKFLSGTSNLLDKTNTFMQKLDEGDKTALEGLKELLQQQMQDRNKNEEAILDTSRKIDRLIDEAIQKMNEAPKKIMR